MKGSIKHVTALHRLTQLVPKLYNKTRWSEKLYVLERFLQLCDFLVILSHDEECESLNDEFLGGISNIPFKTKMEKWVKMLWDIDSVKIYLQKNLIKLNTARNLLHNLQADIQVSENNENAILNGCMLGGTYISSSSNKLVSPHFHGGMIKIPNCKSHEMTQDEKIACEYLKLLTDDNLDIIEEDHLVNLNILRREQKRQELASMAADDTYIKFHLWKHCSCRMNVVAGWIFVK